MSSIDQLASDMQRIVANSNKNKTGPYDTEAKVVKVEDDIVYVHIPGGVDETPVKKTVDAKVGDTVLARFSGGSGWIIGNETAPATDNTVANQAMEQARKAYVYSKEVKDMAENGEFDGKDGEDGQDGADGDKVDGVTTEYCLSSSNSQFIQYGQWSETVPTYISGYYYWKRTATTITTQDEDEEEIQETIYSDPVFSQSDQIAAEVEVAFTNNNNHFWHDEYGAFVSEAGNKSYATGGAFQATSDGARLLRNGKQLTTWTGSGMTFYQNDGVTPIAAYGSGGATFYNGNGVDVASFGSTVRIGAAASDHIILDENEIDFYNHNGVFSGALWTYSYGIDIGYTVDQYNYSTGTYRSGTAGITAQSGSSSSSQYGVLTINYGACSLCCGHGDYYGDTHDSHLQLTPTELQIRKSPCRYDSDITFKVDVATGNVYLNGHSGPIGESVSFTNRSSLDVSNGTDKYVASASLTAGLWLCIYEVTFPADATGDRAIGLTSDSTSMVVDMQIKAATANHATVIRCAKLLAPSSTSTYYLWARQNSGSKLTVSVSTQCRRLR